MSPTRTSSIDRVPAALAGAARQAAAAINDAIESLDGLHRSAFLWDASVSPPGVLRAIADVWRIEDRDKRLEELAGQVHGEARFFDGVEVVRTLGNVEPWLTIRRAVWYLIHAIDETRSQTLGSVARKHSVRGIPRP